MHLSSLTLTNIRQFDQRTFEFHPGFNLLVGENGAGKTTILRSILATLGGTQQMRLLPKLEDDDIQLGRENATVMTIVHSSYDRTEQFYLRKTLWERAERSAPRHRRPLVLLYASNEAICAAMKVKHSKRMRDVGGDSLRRSQEYLHEAEMESGRRSRGSTARRFGNSQSVRNFVGRALETFSPDFRRFYWRFEPYDCSLVTAKGERIKQVPNDNLQKQVRSFAMRYFQERAYRRRRREFQWPDQTKVTLSLDARERGSVKDQLPDLREIWESMRISPKDREFLDTCLLEVKLTPRIMIPREVGSLNLSQLSDGEQRLFSLIVDIARQLSLQNPDDEIGGGEAIVLIDEIDVHLHPRWQREIVPALEDLFSDCQFIATTHSPFVIQAVDSHKVQHLNRLLLAYSKDRGIEEIASRVMGIENHEVGARYLAMLDTAKEFFQLLEAEDKSDPTRRSLLKERLNSLSSRYADNPAYQAYLEMHGQLTLGPDELR